MVWWNNATLTIRYNQHLASIHQSHGSAPESHRTLPNPDTWQYMPRQVGRHNTANARLAIGLRGDMRGTPCTCRRGCGGGGELLGRYIVIYIHLSWARIDSQERQFPGRVRQSFSGDNMGYVPHTSAGGIVGVELRGCRHHHRQAVFMAYLCTEDRIDG